ncbi:hypothetical protein C8N43_2833 [Litoreibacter ponti]|uniref:CBU-0592-like domain-containing protein n=1 Tax=Litoreibacter ponti TaxID=1510457 RepID=A0A2T6BD75_9RHOB|nr:hypothetical protein [Litoreibacter ponti]PTX54028.1 hypothetical protein C8N43_2833 [Litoreibacter ponti]
MPDAVSLYQIIGIAGFLAYMAGFAGLQLGLIDGNGTVYIWTNLVGASLVLISLLHAFNLASLLIQVSWIIIGLAGLIRRARVRAVPRVAHPVPFVRRPARKRPVYLDSSLRVL